MNNKVLTVCSYIMSRTRFRVNLHSTVAWMSRNSLLEAGVKSEVWVTAVAVKKVLRQTFYTFVTEKLLIHHVYSSNLNRYYLNLLPLFPLKRQHFSGFLFFKRLSFIYNRSENLHFNNKNNVCIFDCVVNRKNIRAGGCYGYCYD